MEQQAMQMEQAQNMVAPINLQEGIQDNSILANAEADLASVGNLGL